MTKRIFRSIFLVSALILCVNFAMILGVLYYHFGERLEKELKKEASYLALTVEKNGVDGLEPLSKNDDRVTLIAADGTVLFDNHAETEEMENHLNREEVKEALEKGSGTASRMSATLSEKTVYYAIRLSEGEVLRVSSTQYSVPGLLGGMIQPLILLVGLMLVLSGAVAARISKKVVEPLNQLDLDHPEQNETYEELSPLLSRIKRQQNTIHKQLSNARRQQEEFSIITDNMSEGLLVIDRRTELLSSNASALKLLDVAKADQGKSVLMLNRSEPFRRAVEKVLSGRHAAELMELNDGIRQLLANPVFCEGEVTGGVLLLVDVTEKMQREKLRREFTANVSHELKTPLTSISGFAEIMQDGYVKEEDLKRVAGKIYDEAQRMITLVGDVMEISRLDEGGMTCQEERIDLYEIAEETIRRLQEAADKKELQVELQGDSLIFQTVRSIVEEILYHLLDNAIKYNHQQGSIFLEVFQKEESFGITVKDTGIGIPAIYQERIFERFYRVDKSRSKEIGGTGLGLSIVKHGAACIGANITVESVQGEGAAFTLSWDREQKY